VELFFIDTTPFVDKYWDEEQERTFDWRGVGPRQEYLDSQLKVHTVTTFHFTPFLFKL
jgi:tartrate-resistant acid phosphatase type 5